MKDNWDKAMVVELRFEGGKVDDPQDPGGRTNEGVTQRVYSAYRKKMKKASQDVYLMTPDERDQIYMEQYGWKIAFDQLPPGLDLLILDGAINSGVTQSVKWVQRCLGLTADGSMGDVTLQAVHNHPDHDALIAQICDRRMRFLRALRHWPRYKNGWTSRVNQLRAKAQAWAMGSVGPPVTYVSDMNRRALVTHAVAPPARAVGDALATGGTVSTTLSTAQATLEPLQGNPWVDKIILGLIVGGVVLGGIGFAYGYYARQKKAELEDVLDLVPQGAPRNNDGVRNTELELSSAPQIYQGPPDLARGL